MIKYSSESIETPVEYSPTVCSYVLVYSEADYIIYVYTFQLMQSDNFHLFIEYVCAKNSATASNYLSIR